MGVGDLWRWSLFYCISMWKSHFYILCNLDLFCLTSYLRDDLEPDEYEETRSETLEQLKDFNESLNKMKGGNLSLVDDVNSLQLVSRTQALPAGVQCKLHCAYAVGLIWPDPPWSYCNTRV